MKRMMVKGSLQLYLPLGAVLLTGILLAGNLVRTAATIGVSSSDSPERLLCNGINAPVHVIISWLTYAVLYQLDVSEFLEHLIRAFILYGLYLALVFALWYAVAKELSACQTKESVLTPVTGIRRVADIALVVVGAFLFLYAIGAETHSFYRNSLKDCLFFVPCIVWATTLIWFYGRDLYFYRVNTRKS